MLRFMRSQRVRHELYSNHNSILRKMEVFRGIGPVLRNTSGRWLAYLSLFQTLHKGRSPPLSTETSKEKTTWTEFGFIFSHVS